jgi:acetyl-CoA carboxylase biotin carboxyl carrier protein
MELKDIRQLALLMKETGLTALEYTQGDTSIRMERSVPQSPAPSGDGSKTENTDAPAAPALQETETGGDIWTVTSPMVGVFYTAPAPDQKPYVSVGDHVNAGDVLCIIEAMKMMNEITAEKSGVITEICVGNKQIVEYGHPLFRLRLD